MEIHHASLEEKSARSDLVILGEVTTRGEKYRSSALGEWEEWVVDYVITVREVMKGPVGVGERVTVTIPADKNDTRRVPRWDWTDDLKHEEVLLLFLAQKAEPGSYLTMPGPLGMYRGDLTRGIAQEIRDFARTERDLRLDDVRAIAPSANHPGSR